MSWAALGSFAAGAGLGALKGKGERAQAAKQNLLNATTALYSPWTGLTPGENKYAPSAFASAVDGGMQGLSMNQNFESAAADGELKEAYKNNLNRQNPQQQPQQQEAPGGLYGNYWSNKRKQTGMQS
jgi:hypothetical protein